MASRHFLNIYTPDGRHLDSLNDFESIECVLSELNIGTLVVTLPATHEASFYQRDARIAYERAPSADLSSGTPRLVGGTTWLLARVIRALNRDLQEKVRLVCVHPNALLARRVIAYDEGTSQADKTAAADNMIKEIVDENFVSATDTTRNWSSSIFSVEADTSAAPSVSKAASYRTVLMTLQEIAAAAAAAGTYTGFEVTGRESGAYMLRTYTGQRGVDRSSSGSQSLILSVVYGSMNEVILDDNWMDMASFVYAGGSGKRDERQIGTASSAALIAQSPYGRIEWFQNVAQTDDSTTLDSEAARALRERRPRQIFEGDVADTAYATFGEEYDWGDRVIGEYSPSTGFGFVRQFDCRIDPVRIRADRTEDEETGEIHEAEVLDIRLRSESA